MPALQQTELKPKVHTRGTFGRSWGVTVWELRHKQDLGVWWTLPHQELNFALLALSESIKSFNILGLSPDGMKGCHPCHSLLRLLPVSCCVFASAPELKSILTPSGSLIKYKPASAALLRTTFRSLWKKVCILCSFRDPGLHLPLMSWHYWSSDLTFTCSCPLSWGSENSLSPQKLGSCWDLWVSDFLNVYPQYHLLDKTPSTPSYAKL